MSQIIDYFNVQIKNDEGKVISTHKVKRVKRSQLKDLVVLHQDLIYQFLATNASIGSILADDNNWNTIIKIANMLNVVGQIEVGLDITEIENDIEQLTRIFFTESIDEYGTPTRQEDGWYQPSLLAKLHQLNYYGDVQEAIKKIKIE